MRQLIALTCTVLLAACASEQPTTVASASQAAAAPAAAASAPKMVCRNEAAVGELVKRTVCRPDDSDEASRNAQAARDLIDQMHHTSMPSGVQGK